MRETTRKALTGLMALAAAGGLTAGIADAAKKHHGKKGAKATKRHAGAGRHHFGPPGRPFARPAELTGADADSAKAAALDAVPGGTVRHSFKAPDGGPDGNVAYVVMVEKSDGAPVLVLLDKDFKLVRTLDRPMHGPDGDGPHGGPPNEPELSGDDADKAKAAAADAVPGGTVWRTSKEDPAENSGAVYEVHVRKADGSEVEVLLDADFKVVKTQAFEHPGPPPGMDGDHQGPPPGPPGAGYGAPPPPPGSPA
jgi:hypothetical protein